MRMHVHVQVCTHVVCFDVGVACRREAPMHDCVCYLCDRTLGRSFGQADAGLHAVESFQKEGLEIWKMVIIYFVKCIQSCIYLSCICKHTPCTHTGVHPVYYCNGLLTKELLFGGHL